MSGNYPHHSMYMAAEMDSPEKQMVVFWESVDQGVTGPLTYNGGVGGDHRWHKIEIYIRHNTIGQNDGVIRFWNDGVLRIDAQNTRTRSSTGQKWAELSLMSNWSNNPGWEHDAINNVYWDDIEIYSDLGAGAVGSMFDGTVVQSP
jgi:hypothetical protein